MHYVAYASVQPLFNLSLMGKERVLNLPHSPIFIGEKLSRKNKNNMHCFELPCLVSNVYNPLYNFKI